MKIVSLLPSATELIRVIGFRANLAMAIHRQPAEKSSIIPMFPWHNVVESVRFPVPCHFLDN